MRRLRPPHYYQFREKGKVERMGRLARDAARDWVEANAVVVSGAAAIPMPVPGAHTVLSTAIEGYMVYRVAQVFGRNLSSKEAVALVSSLGGAVIAGKTLSIAVGETLGQVPFLGWIAKGAVSGGVAYAIGRAAVAYFDLECPGREAAEGFESVGFKDFLAKVWDDVRR
jgi:uncharacterized protein (DUF697 family)